MDHPSENVLAGSPFTDHPPACDKCQLIDCHSIHDRDHAGLNCPHPSCEVCLDLAKLDAQILDAHQLLVDLVQKRREMKNKSNFHHDGTHRLPVEIVSLIFVFFKTSGDYFYAKGYKGKHVWYPPLLLGAVCRRWREITLGIPELWTTIKIDLRRHSTQIDFVKEWLGRSGSLPISITIRRSFAANDDSSSKDSILDVVKSLASRWRNVWFYVPSFIFHYLLHDLEDIPSVDSLHIDLTGVLHKSIYLRELLRPKRLTVRWISIQYLPFQWNDLTYLRVDEMRRDNVLHIIRHAPNLMHCITDAMRMDGGEYTLPTTSIVSRSLTHLEANTPSSADIIPYLNLPFLEYVKYVYAPSASIDMSILSLLERSGDPFGESLDTFEFQYQEYQGALGWLELFPAITLLKLDTKIEHPSRHNAMVLDAFFRTLTRTSETTVLPNLVGLTIETYKMQPSSWSLIGAFLAENVEASHPNTSESQIDTLGSFDLSSPAEYYGRPLVSVYIRQKTTFTEGDILMSKETFTQLLDIQKSGMMLDLVDENENDLLEHMGRIYI